MGDAAMKLRNVLLVTYHFPPHGGSGVQRAAKLAKYLPAAGWRVHVLAAGHEHYPLLDHSLLDDVGEAAITRLCGCEPAAVAARLCRHLGGRQRTAWVDWLEDRLYWRLERLVGRLRLPETELLWAPAAISAARKLVRLERIEAVITTSPPIAAHLVGLHLKRRLGVPWIADLRDPILDNFAREPGRPLVDRYLSWIERATLQAADHVVVTCPDLRERLLERYPNLAASRISTITNGFDPADAPLSAKRPRSAAESMIADRAFTVAHVGALYREQSIDGILAAVRAVRASRSDVARRLRLRVIGSLSASQRRSIRPDDAAFLVDCGYRRHREAVEEMATADALLLTTPANANGRYCIPAKTFEYLAFGGHVIAVAHQETALWWMLAQAGNVTVLRHGDEAGLAQAVEARYDAWQAGLPDQPRDMELVKTFRRDRQARSFARLCAACVDGTTELRLVQESDAVQEAA